MSNWSAFLPAVQHIYNTTVNESTGMTPYYLNHGRECPSPDLDFARLPVKDLNEHVEGLKSALATAWAHVGGPAWRQKTEDYNRRPKVPLQFVPYEVNQLVFIKRIPRRFYKNPQEEEQTTLSSKLQARYAGPYRILARKSDVLYEALVHGKRRVIHAVNMKPAHINLHVAPLPADPELADAQAAVALQQENENAEEIGARIQAAALEAVPHAARDAAEDKAVAAAMLDLRKAMATRTE